jgi:iron complex transport system substrate-binding protein
MVKPSSIVGFAVAGLALAIVAWQVVEALRVGVGETDRTHRGAEEGYPRIVTFPDGSEFTVPARPVRIVAATSRAIDYLAALCEPERIVGFPEQALEYATLDPAQEAALSGATRFHAYVAEPVLRLQPDLVVADVWQSADTHARLRASRIPHLVLPQSLTWSDARALLLALGRVVDREEVAERLVSDGDARIATLAEAVKGRVRLRAVAYSNFGAQGFSAGSGTSIHEIIELAGLENAVAADGGVGHLDMTFERLLRLDPDVIVVSAPLNAPSAHTGDRGGASEAILLGEPGLAGLRAVRDRRIVALPAGLFATASYRLVHAAETLAALVEAHGAAEVVR